MKTVFENVIKQGNFVLGQMLNKIDTYHVNGKLTDADRDYLYSLARGKANPAAEIEIYAKLAELEDRVRKLESGEAVSGDTTAKEYVAGKWYRAGDKVIFEGKTYTCIAPAGTVCTWSPSEYPAYWEEG